MLFVYILLKIILYILLVLVLLLLTVLFIPFKYNINGEKMESTSLEGSVSWLFGGVKMRFNYNSENGTSTMMSLMGFQKKMDTSKKNPRNKQIDKATKNDSKKKRVKPAYSYFTYEVLKQGLQSVLKTLNYCKPRKFNVDAKIGFDDPMYTGLLCGIQNTGYAFLDKYHIHLKTVFEDEVVEGNFVIGGGIQIFYLLLVAIGFVFTKPFRSILFKNIKIKIKRRLKRWQVISISMKT